MALIALAEKLLPHSFTVIALTLIVLGTKAAMSKEVRRSGLPEDNVKSKRWLEIA